MTGALHGLDRVDRRLRQAVDGAAALLLAGVTSLGVAQVFWRYALNSSIVWSEEAIRLAFVWLIFVGAANAPHLRVDLLTSAVGPAAGRALRIVRQIVAIGLLAVVVQGALELSAAFGSDSYVTLPLTKSWYWSAAIVGGLLWAGLAVTDAILTLAGGERST